MTSPLVSIIIPIYKVEPYLKCCLDSIINQSYTNLEIILVDDGSPDNCPQICDEYAKKDNRIVIIHKKNGGLSDARNAGLDIAKGDFIYFLDGDDYLGKEVISCLYDHIQNKDNIAIAIGYFTAVNRNEHKPYRKEWIFNNPQVIEPIDFANRMLMEKSNFAATAKLYRRELFKNLRFRINVKNEDTLFIADLIPIIEKQSFSCIDVPNYSYYYTQHTQSITHDKNDPLERHVIKNYSTIIQMFSDRLAIVNYLKKKQFDLFIELQKKALKNGNLNAYIDNEKNIKKIPLIFAIKKKSIRFLLYFIIMKYAPQILFNFKHK